MRLYHGDEDEQTLTNHLRWLNKAAIIRSPTNDPIVEVRSWRLCTVKEVEHTKTLLGMIQMALTFVIYGMVKSVGDTFFIEQANNMHRYSDFVLIMAIASLPLVAETASFLVKWLYKRILEKRINETKKRYSDGMKIGLGMLASTFCCTVASWVEAKRLKTVRLKILREKGELSLLDAKSPMSVFWLIPQFFFMGAMDGLARDGIQDFFYHYVPRPMRRYGTIFTNVLTACGIILVIGFEAIIDQYNKSQDHASWIGNSINESHVDYLYRALAAMTILNLFIYAYIATRYSYENVEGVAEEEEEILVPVVNEAEEAAQGNQIDEVKEEEEAATVEGKEKEVDQISEISARNLG